MVPNDVEALAPVIVLAAGPAFDDQGVGARREHEAQARPGPRHAGAAAAVVATGDADAPLEYVEPDVKGAVAAVEGDHPGLGQGEVVVVVRRNPAERAPGQRRGARHPLAAADLALERILDRPALEPDRVPA